MKPALGAPIGEYFSDLTELPRNKLSKPERDEKNARMAAPKHNTQDVSEHPPLLEY
jgi:hypothetical protein